MTVNEDTVRTIEESIYDLIADGWEACDAICDATEGERIDAATLDAVLEKIEGTVVKLQDHDHEDTSWLPVGLWLHREDPVAMLTEAAHCIEDVLLMHERLSKES